MRLRPGPPQWMRAVLAPLVLLAAADGLRAQVHVQASVQLPAEIVPREWLVIAPLDVEGRRPFRADAVFAAHLLDRASPPPVAGDALSGELGVEQRWVAGSAAEDGTLPGLDGGRVAWAFTTIDTPADGVMLAQLSGASMLWVNGEPFPGDGYGLGFSPVPVALHAGRNALFVSGVRGEARLRLTRPEHALLLGTGDMTRPDILVGLLPQEPVEMGVLVLNASLQAVPALQLDAGHGTDARGAFGLPPLGVLKLPVTVLEAGQRLPDSALPHMRDPSPPGSRMPTGPLPLQLGGHPDEPARSESFALDVCVPGEVTRHTYRSAVDDSVQEYAVRWPALPAWSFDGQGGLVVPEPKSLLLTLHGAGVMPAGQAGSYSARPDFWIVAPSNRRAFGFDWQDWGRRDACDVLQRALSLPGVDEVRVFLAGHSMGGHGTWHLAANDPDRFLAIAPSAGWASFDTYGGRPAGALAELWHGADGASLTPSLIENLVQLPAYIVHGTADDNVPASEARAMEAALIEAGRAPLTHYEEGAGHWWDGPAAPGADCVDWPGIFELFRATPTPEDAAAAAAVVTGSAGAAGVTETTGSTGATGSGGDVDWHWISVDPGVDAVHHGLVALQPLQYGVPMRLALRWSRALDTCEVRTSNVRRFGVRRWPGATPPATLLLDGLVVPDGGWSEPGATQASFVRADEALADRGAGRGGVHDVALVDAGAWSETTCPAGALDGPRLSWPEAEKSPASCGPFKRAFDRGFVLVYGTSGDAAENAELLARARSDATAWWYRGNGCAPLLSDRQFLSPAGRAACAGRNLIVYGNADSNAAWPVVVPANCPLQARRGALALGERRWEGADLGAVCVFPRADRAESGDGAALAGPPLVGLFADSGARGTRLGIMLAPFVSGVGYPDYAVFGPDVLRAGDAGVMAAGWFDALWRSAASVAER